MMHIFRKKNKWIRSFVTSAKCYCINNCPEYILKPAVIAFRKIKGILYRIDMLLFSEKMTGYCPCCGLKFRTFAEGNYLKQPNRYNSSRYIDMRQDVLCPFCKSMPRHRILAMWCNQHKKLLRSSRILYFAPEKSMMLWMKRSGITCTTADLYSEAVDLKIDIQATGLPDASFDMIICNHVLEHVDDFRIALKEIYRILPFGGSLICSFPMDPKVKLLDEDPSIQSAEQRVQRFGQNDHKRVFGMDAEWFLTETGFTVEKISGETFPEIILPIVGPGDYDMNCLFYCKKRCI